MIYNYKEKGQSVYWDTNADSGVFQNRISPSPDYLRVNYGSEAWARSPQGC